MRYSGWLCILMACVLRLADLSAGFPPYENVYTLQSIALLESHDILTVGSVLFVCIDCDTPTSGSFAGVQGGSIATAAGGCVHKSPGYSTMGSIGIESSFVVGRKRASC